MAMTESQIRRENERLKKVQTTSLSPRAAYLHQCIRRGVKLDLMVAAA